MVGCLRGGMKERNSIAGERRERCRLFFIPEREAREPIAVIVAKAAIWQAMLSLRYGSLARLEISEKYS
jgi:hypothetical protein